MLPSKDKIDNNRMVKVWFWFIMVGVVVYFLSLYIRYESKSPSLPPVLEEVFPKVEKTD